MAAGTAGYALVTPKQSVREPSEVSQRGTSMALVPTSRKKRLANGECGRPRNHTTLVIQVTVPLIVPRGCKSQKVATSDFGPESVPIDQAGHAPLATHQF